MVFFDHDFLILSIKVFSLFSILFFYPSFPSPFHFPCSIISFCSSWLPCFSLHLQNKREKRKSKFKKNERNGRTSLIFSFSSFFSGFFHFLVLSNLLSPALLLIYSSFSWRWREKRLGILGAQPYSDMWTWRQRLELSLQFTWHQYVSITWSHQISSGFHGELGQGRPWTQDCSQNTTLCCAAQSFELFKVRIDLTIKTLSFNLQKPSLHLCSLE